MADTYLPAGMAQPVPAPDGVDSAFWEGAKQKELRLQRCEDCGTFQVPAEWTCYRCHSLRLTWEALAGHGRVFTWARVWHPVQPALAGACPYIIVVVEVEGTGGCRLAGNLIGDPLQRLDIGDAVEAVFEEHEGGYTLVQWKAVA